MFLEKKECKHYELYKKDSKGKIRYLIIDTENEKVIQKSGIVGGKEVLHESHCLGKNIGRSNETTPIEQAKLVAKSKFEEKLKKGYFKTKDEAENEEVILPMLAKVYGKESHKIDWTTGHVYAQPKYDGMRCLAIFRNGEITLMSRAGNEITTMQHIKDDLITIYSEGLILDGELYSHDHSFQENMKLCKKYRPGETEAIDYVVYDMLMDAPFNVRYNSICGHLANALGSIKLSDTFVVLHEDDLMDIHSDNISDGYEGTIVRHGQEDYKVNGRSSHLLKLKDFHDIAIKLIDVEESEKRPGYGKPIFHWPGAENDRLGAGVALDHRMCQDLLTNKDKYIGKTGELRFFEYSDTGVPRHPVLHGFRLDK